MSKNKISIEKSCLEGQAGLLYHYQITYIIYVYFYTSYPLSLFYIPIYIFRPIHIYYLIHLPLTPTLLYLISLYILISLLVSIGVQYQGSTTIIHTSVPLFYNPFYTIIISCLLILSRGVCIVRRYSISILLLYRSYYIYYYLSYYCY